MDIIEKIANTLHTIFYELTGGDIDRDDWTEDGCLPSHYCFRKAKEILAVIKETGYVKLADVRKPYFDAGLNAFVGLEPTKQDELREKIAQQIYESKALDDMNTAILIRFSDGQADLKLTLARLHKAFKIVGGVFLDPDQSLPIIFEGSLTKGGEALLTQEFVEILKKAGFRRIKEEISELQL